MKLKNIFLYRMVHIENIPHILKNGITHRSSQNSNPHFISIGDTSLIDTRSIKTVIIDNGIAVNLNATSIILGDYIPFYFGIKMPMLYVIQHGGNFVEEATTAEKIIYLACPINDIIQLGGAYYFSDGHATSNSLTSFYDSSKIKDLPNIIDWNAIKAPFWAGQENLDLKTKKQAEFLFGDDIPPNLVKGYCCYNDNAKARMIEMGIIEAQIKVLPTAYFEI